MKERILKSGKAQVISSEEEFYIVKIPRGLIKSSYPFLELNVYKDCEGWLCVDTSQMRVKDDSFVGEVAVFEGQYIWFRKEDKEMKLVQDREIEWKLKITRSSKKLFYFRPLRAA